MRLFEVGDNESRDQSKWNGFFCLYTTNLAHSLVKFLGKKEKKTLKTAISAVKE